MGPSGKEAWEMLRQQAEEWIDPSHRCGREKERGMEIEREREGKKRWRQRAKEIERKIKKKERQNERA